MTIDMSNYNSEIQGAFELAAMSIPHVYFEPPKQDLFSRAKRALGIPGPKPRLKEITYRGDSPPALFDFYKRHGEYRENNISLETYDLIRKNPIVRLGLVARAAPTITAIREARVDSSDLKLKAFIEEVVVSEWLMRLAQTSIIPSYIYGLAPHEKVWEYQNRYITYIDEMGQEQVAWDGPALVYKKLKYVSPKSIDRMLLQKDSQDYAGFVQTPPPGEVEKPIGPEKTFTYINQFIYGGLWGESELDYIYPHWYYLEFFRALLADYLKLDAVPPIVGYAPPGKSYNDDGEEVDNLKYAGEILQQAYASMVVMLPHETDDRGNEMWRYQELRIGDHGTVYERAIESLQVDILRGLLVPERTITQDRAAVGSYNQAAIHAERLLDMAKMEVDNFIVAVNEWLVPVIAEDHFGVNHAPVKVFTQSMSEDLKEKLFNIVITLLQNDKFSIMSQQVAFKELLDFLRIPYTMNDEGILTPADLMGGNNEENDQGSEDDSDQA